MVQEQAVIEGWRGVLVDAGLGTPMKRATAAVLLVGCISYAIKPPQERGDVTKRNFLLMPLTVGTVVYLFT